MKGKILLLFLHSVASKLMLQHLVSCTCARETWLALSPPYALVSEEKVKEHRVLPLGPWSGCRRKGLRQLER